MHSSKGEGRSYSAYEMRDLNKHDVESKRSLLKVPAVESVKAAGSSVPNAFELHPSVKKVLEIERDENSRIEKKVNEKLALLRESTIEDAKKVGFQEGYEAGRKEGFQRFQEETRESVEVIDRLATEFEGLKAEIFKANERFLLEMIAQVAKRVVLRELQTDADYLSRVTRDIIEKLGTRENIRVWLNGDDIECLQALRESLTQKFGELRNLQIAVHPEVTKGGCIVETDFGTVDATIEAQIRSIEETLIGKS